MGCRSVVCVAPEQAAETAAPDEATTSPEARSVFDDGPCERCGQFSATAGRACLFCPANAI